MAESGEGRKKWFVCAVAMLLGISEPLDAPAGPGQHQLLLQAGADKGQLPFPEGQNNPGEKLNISMFWYT